MAVGYVFQFSGRSRNGWKTILSYISGSMDEELLTTSILWPRIEFLEIGSRELLPIATFSRASSRRALKAEMRARTNDEIM